MSTNWTKRRKILCGIKAVTNHLNSHKNGTEKTKCLAPGTVDETQNQKSISSEEKIQIVLEGLRREESIAALCRKYGIHEPKLLCDNGSNYIVSEFNDFIKAESMTLIHGRSLHPQTQGKIERYN